MSKHFNILTPALLALASVSGYAAPAQALANAREEHIEMWSKNHPEASNDLGSWVKAHPEAAHLFFDWDGHHHEQSQELVRWAIANPGQGIDTFAASHKEHWDYVDRIMQNHRPAANEFLDWARKHHEAANSLMKHPGGLEWAGHHLFKDEGMMKH